MENNNGPETEYRIKINPVIFRILAVVVGIIGFLIILSLLFPAFVSAILNILWLLLLGMIIIFFTLGILVIFGMRKEVSRILDVFLESSLTIIDIGDLLKLFYKRFVITLKEFTIYIAPVIALIISLIIYFVLIFFYKWYGSKHDVTFVTLVITFIGVGIVGLLTIPRKTPPQQLTWRRRFLKRFNRAFIDGLEIVMVLFFLTMDSTRLFFLPDNLNIPLTAQVGGIDLMQRSYELVKQNYKVTFNLIGIALLVEIIRNSLRIFAVARAYYKQQVARGVLESGMSKSELRKRSIRVGFYELKDEIIKFIGFTTVLFAGFIFFPRLKLATLVVASLTALLLDIFIPARLSQVKGQDLLSRIVIKIFRL